MDIPNDIMEKIKEEYLNGKSLRELSKIYGIDRKRLSLQLKKSGITVTYRYNDELIQEAIRLYEQGESISKVANKLKVDRHILSTKLAAANVREKTPPKNKIGLFKKTNETDEIFNRYVAGDSILSLASEYGRSSNFISNVLDHYEAIDNNRVSRKYLFDENIFEVIDEEEKAYWLGFLMADGCVHESLWSIEISLKSSDKAHLEKFVDFINPVPRIEVKEKSIILNDKQINVWRVLIHSKKMAIDLAKQGCKPAKSLILSFPEWLKESPLLRHFMRGYFDGDGCLTAATGTHMKKPQLNFGIVGTYDFCVAFDDILYKKKIIKSLTKMQPTGKAFQTRHGGNIQAKKLFDFLYYDSNVYLDRKHELFTAVLGGNTERLLVGN